MKISFLIAKEQQTLQKSVIQVNAGHIALSCRLTYSLGNGIFNIVCVFWIFLSGILIRHHLPHTLMGKNISIVHTIIPHLFISSLFQFKIFS